MIGRRTPIPGVPGWHIGTLLRGFDPTREGLYVEIYIHVDVDVTRTLVVRVPGRPDDDEILDQARDHVVGWVYELPVLERDVWLDRWARARLECLVCRKVGPECGCEDGPYSYPADLEREVSALRHELSFD